MSATPFRLERVKREMTQDQLAALSGVSQHRISVLERGVTPRPDEARALADVFKVKPEELFQTT
jgi:transcriptional regulator with XRE-family HTH domain